jgi:hypothetical protein
MIKNAKPFFLKPGWANANACHSHAGKFCISIGRIFMIDLVGNTLFFHYHSCNDIDDLIHSGNPNR